MDSTFVDGQFGFYNYSQENVKYEGFEQTGGQSGRVPDGGSTAFLLALGLGMLRWAKR